MSQMRVLLSATWVLSGLAGCIEYGIKGFGSGGGTSVEDVLSEPDKQVDSWEATGTDLLFFGDTSDSMASELETMGEHARTFMDRLDDYDKGWQIIVVTGWDGCSVNGIISPSVSDYDQVFAEALITPPDEEAVEAGADEWGLYSVDKAIQASSSGGCNEGFLRENALLHIIILSDEPDSSPGWDGEDATYWQVYVDNVIAATGGERLVTYSAVVGPEPDGCTGADPGTGYIDAVAYTGGSELSICEEWYTELDSLVSASVEVTDFPLSRTPMIGSIRVEVAGTARTSGWEYQATGNLVHFAEDLPTIRDEVSISYEVAD